MSPESPRQPRRRPRAPILASGLLDRDWVGAQLGTAFASDADAVDRYLDDETDCSPHPLFEDSWCKRLAGRVPGRPAGTRHRVAAPTGRRRPDRRRAPGGRPASPRSAGLVGRRRPARTPPCRCRTESPRSPGGGCAAPPSRRPSGGRRAVRRGSPSAVPARHPRPSPTRPRSRRRDPSRWSRWSWWSATTGLGCERCRRRAGADLSTAGSSSSSTTVRPTTPPPCWPVWRPTSHASSPSRCRVAVAAGPATPPSTRLAAATSPSPMPTTPGTPTSCA